MVAALLAAMAAGCSESADSNSLEVCRDYLDTADWDLAIEACDLDTDESKGKLAQAYMGRASVSLLDLLDGLENSDLDGEALIFDIFTVSVGSTQYDDIDTAITTMLSMQERTDTDNFNLTIASDVLLMSLLTEHLAISIDEDSGAFEVPGVTNVDFTQISDPTNFSSVQSVFQDIYATAGSYYRTQGLEWQSTVSGIPDLQSISTFVQANQTGAEGLGLTTNPDLADLSALSFAGTIDNGQCGYASGTTTIDPVVVARTFQRRLNTSDPDAQYVGDTLYFVLLTLNTESLSAETDDDKEWGGEFGLPSALVNPLFYAVKCDSNDSTASVGEFDTCMEDGTTAISPNTPGADNTLDPALTETPQGDTGICDGSACTSWPLLPIDGDILTSEATESLLETARTELSQVLDAAYPIDNSNTDPTTNGAPLPCASGDGWVHAREYDYYLRNLGL